MGRSPVKPKRPARLKNRAKPDVQAAMDRQAPLEARAFDLTPRPTSRAEVLACLNRLGVVASFLQAELSELRQALRFGEAPSERPRLPVPVRRSASTGRREP